MNISDIRGLSDTEIKKKLEDSHKELFELRLKLSTRQLVNHRELPRVKNDIARILTVMRERELQIR
ncbi:50S ribosomal protein L29 [Dehalococcoides mccartyi]|jgi:large subunit ribosomal protein L29|uniref:Large ribosomal subunit protein uL29 n=3 Tax=Dehalococcoides mccartyi TaxID=61435 RepID=RL29_DEHMC|nr:MULTISPECIES: 50S ribosomal protein L29 [Dehalococcoides]A5FRY3.1 RecName: Full=Large ribosomal subunit protein uL29; AltName: Full=50S ribosomal protein L29 [Dehalococcoides mccartyi BAV1]Q3ZZL6.1 RecName: Full=Large ribosomal subunit protein uL29; AltName: Full=50S ribosomal protein L29 [Dehalococcoides mccartyi CBDB1]AGG06120.1 50S ribosomal protein L29 [Dehalococcoides mccartyi DCMB5]AGG07552.1 50S ribosomal protein L29 [Dehalococcoides mccartyi BTF08]AII60584.1 50S ribosomal protein L2